MQRYELRNGKFGPYFHDTKSKPDGLDMPLDMVLEKLNRLDEYTERLATANKKRRSDQTY